MGDIETEIEQHLHPKPKSGSLGNERLDFCISFAENQLAAARQEIEGTEPRSPNTADKANAVETMRQYKRRADYQVNNQLATVDQSIELTTASGERGFTSYNPRPQNISDEVLGRRWDSFKMLFDSLVPSVVILRIKEELDKACLPYGGDELSKFLLRDGEGLVRMYLESRKASLDAYFEAVRDTAQVYESDLIEGCNTVLLARRLAKAWPRIKASLQNQVYQLDSLILKQSSSWDKPASGISVQSDQSGSINARFESIEDFRKFCRKQAF